MLISSSLPSSFNSGRLPQPGSQRGQIPLDRTSTFPEPPQQRLLAPEKSYNQFRFVLPDNATTRSGKIALREYAMIQSSGGPELVNRIDVRV